MTVIEPRLTFEAVVSEDISALADLRVLAMQPSLERVGRFDVERARQRLLTNFSLEYTKHISFNAINIGFIVLRPQGNDFLLDHFYLHPDFQNQGFGSIVLNMIFDEMDQQTKHLHVGALRNSDANRFYIRHGFVFQHANEYDNYYVRYPKLPSK